MKTKSKLEVKVNINEFPCLMQNSDGSRTCIYDGDSKCKYPHFPEMCNYYFRHVTRRINIEVRYRWQLKH
jgi:hypothetical protein